MAYNIIPQRGVFSTIANLINENFQRIYQQILGLDGSGEQAAEDISQLESDVSALQSGKANDADVVHKAGTETITGNKTFTGTVKLPLQNSGILVTDENGVVQSDSNTYAGAQTSGGAANKAVSIPFGQVDNTSTSTAFTATVDGITELRDGVCVYLKNGVVTSAANCTLNVNGLGAKPIYISTAAASRVSTVFNKNYTLLLVYNSSRVDGGCWDYYYGYDSNSDTIGYQLRTNAYTLPASDTSRYYKLFFTSADNTKWVPASADSTNNATSARPVNQRPINPFGPIVYAHSTANFTTGTNVTATAIWQQYPLTFGYSFNRTGAALTLTIGKPVFVKCAPQNDGSAIIDANTPYVQDLPTTEDGKIYIFLGVAYSATQVEMQMVHPVYYYKNGAINLWTGTGTQTDVFKPTESNVIDVGEYDLMKINEVKGKSLVWNQLVIDCPTRAEVYGITRTRVNAYTIHYSGTSTTTSSYTGTGTFPVVYGHNYYAAINGAPQSCSIRGGRLAISGSVQSAIITSVDTANDGSLAVYIPSGTTIDNDVSFICVDLTQMFGAGNEPTTVEEVEAILGEDYYEYNTGEVVGNNVEKLDVTGFNIWDEEWEAGTLNPNTGLPEASQSTTHIRSKNYNLIIPNCTYFGYRSGLTGRYTLYVAYYDSNKNFISSGSVCNITFTSPANAKYFKLWTAQVDYGNTYNNDICINKSNTSKNGTYEPYKHSEFPLNLTELTGKVNGEGTSVTIFPTGLHGVGTAYDSLIVDEDGYARRAIKRMGSVDLGSCTITSGGASGTTSFVHVSVDGLDSASSTSATLNALCSSSKFTIGTQAGWSQTKYQISRNNNTGKSLLITYDNTEYDFSTFKSSLSGVYLDFELSTPIEYVLDTPVQCVAKVYPNGTVKQVPVMPDSTPMVMDVTYLKDNGGMIGGLMNRLASLEPRMDDLAKGIKTISVQYGDATNIILETEKINGNEGTVSIPAATSQAAGAMSAAQAALLEDLSDLADDIETLLASI